MAHAIEITAPWDPHSWPFSICLGLKVGLKVALPIPPKSVPPAATPVAMAYGIKKITGWACHGPGMMRLKIHLAGQPSSPAGWCRKAKDQGHFMM